MANEISSVVAGSGRAYNEASTVVHGGEYVSFFFRVLVGTATATEVYRGTIGVNGFFE